MVSPSACATLRVTAKRAENLKNLQTLIDQDPFVRLTILPWGDSEETKAASGTDPEWKAKHRPVIELPYPGRPVPPEKAELLVEVYDAEVTRADRIIGSATVDLADELRKSALEEPHEISLELSDPKGKSAGTVYLDFEVIMRGTFDVTVNSGHNLKNIHTVMDQNPYVRITFLPVAEGAEKQVFSTKSASGANPVWTKKNVLTFEYDGEEKPRLLVEVFDDELFQKDRLVGTAAVDLIKRVLNNGPGSREVKKELIVELVDEEFVSAGRLDLTVHFVNEAWDDSKPILRALSSKELHVADLNAMSGSEIWDELRRVFFQIESELENSAPGFLNEFVRPGLSLSGLFAIMWLFLGMAGMYIFIKHGAKLLSLCVGVLYPCYASFKAIETEGKDDDTQWLTYWMIFGTSMILEETALKVPAMLQPGLFFICKMAFLIWLASPKYQGAAFLYKRFVAPLLRKYESHIDKRIKSARRAVKEIDERVRLEPSAVHSDDSDASDDEDH